MEKNKRDWLRHEYRQELMKYVAGFIVVPPEALIPIRDSIYKP